MITLAEEVSKYRRERRTTRCQDHTHTTHAIAATPMLVIVRTKWLTLSRRRSWKSSLSKSSRSFTGSLIHFFARFTKDLKPDDISLNFLRGKGELRNLELNAELINEVLRLPPWIAVSKVHCDSIRVSVPFTDLHRSPIHAVSWC